MGVLSHRGIPTGVVASGQRGIDDAHVAARRLLSGQKLKIVELVRMCVLPEIGEQRKSAMS